ncbi:MAG TPA: NAD(P)/FAD-dependent oxidoreductase [Candidatus Saccharimonadales bacterium]|nr:NAD(P)/FAD-dependent oxidoreductase [Candidatus Saccharimonadales bacterium]
MSRAKRTAIIIGAGPAGLTAAYELLKNTDIKPIVFEASNDIGGISKTINYKGNRIDIGGHRFFSKSDRVMEWWQNILPLEKTNASKVFTLRYQGKNRKMGGGDGVDPKNTDDVMLVRSRLSRIYYGGQFYNYPITLDATTIKNLGVGRIIKMGVSYVKARLKPIPEKSLEDFYVNRFGRELYNTFFRDYTEKVWGVPCSDIAPDWGAQRIKGLSVSKAVAHAIKKPLTKKRTGDIAQKDTETSLIEYFLYPKLGPGHMWETVARLIKKQGGEVLTGQAITKLQAKDGKILSVTVTDYKSGKSNIIKADYFFSTMPIKELIASIEGIEVPRKVQTVASGLLYRDFITVGLLMKKLKINNETSHKTKGNIIPDNWIYIQEPGVKVGRLQIFNNWSPYLVKDENNIWIGMEYFVNEGDSLWNMKDEDMALFGIEELANINIIDKKQVLDNTVIRIKKTYPAYFGTYDRINEIKNFTDKFENLFLLGRNGQHRYNNQDHSMLTAMEAVNNIKTGRKDKKNVWNVNVEQEYHEQK